MTKTIQVETRNLEGAALDYAIEEATGNRWMYPSTDPRVGFPILVENRVSLMSRYGRTPERDYWFAQVGPEEPENETLHDHKDPLVAGLRAVVQYKLGDVVEIPKELMGDDE